MANIRNAYVKYIAKIFTLAGDDSAAAKQEAPSNADRISIGKCI